MGRAPLGTQDLGKMPKVVKIITKMIESWIFIDNFCHRLTLDQWGTTIFYKKRGQGQRKNNANIQPKYKKNDPAFEKNAKKIEPGRARKPRKGADGQAGKSKRKAQKAPRNTKETQKHPKAPQDPSGKPRNNEKRHRHRGPQAT